MNLKTAVIGVGSMGRNHARVYWDLPDVRLVWVADKNAAVVRGIAKRYNTHPYTDFRRLLDEQQPDVVTIAVTTNSHLDIALEVIQRGIHVLIEKPIASTAEEARAIIDAARKTNVQLMVGHIERFNPADLPPIFVPVLMLDMAHKSAVE